MAIDKVEKVGVGSDKEGVVPWCGLQYLVLRGGKCEGDGEFWGGV